MENTQRYVYQISFLRLKTKYIQFTDRIRKCLWNYSEKYSKWCKKMEMLLIFSLESHKNLACGHNTSSLSENVHLFQLFMLSEKLYKL